MGLATPVRSLTSLVSKWPDRAEVDAAVRRWATLQKALHPELRRLGYFGSFTRGDWGVGSDLDLIALVVSSDRPLDQRPLAWDLTPSPVPAEMLVFTPAERQRLEQDDRRFASTIQAKTVWR
jgi:hypothetical protein